MQRCFYLNLPGEGREDRHLW